MCYEIIQGAFCVSDDPSRLDIAAIHHFLAEESYWATGRSLEIVQRSIEHSLCFGVYKGSQQVGFARVITDLSTFAWLCDVFILPAFRGQGLSKMMIKAIVDHPQLANLRRFLLATRDAHGLYRTYGGFQPLSNPERWMERLSPNPNSR